MRELTIEYSHEFISNKITDELILNELWNYSKLELEIIDELNRNFSFNPGLDRNINTLSGGQRVLVYLVTLSIIIKEKNISDISLNLNNLLESLTAENSNKISVYLHSRGINVT